ncbi:MAG: pyruvate kinase [Desulfurococcales archaeon]|nr:pyruvate kinase [Desulfurococcales archaeon]
MRTKIITSIGPASKNPEILREFYRLGIRCMRINFAHGDARFWGEIVNLVRDLETSLGDFLCLIGDLPGPSIRLGDFGELAFKRGSRVVFSNTGDGVPVRESDFYELVDEGDIILLDDGRVVLEVISSSWGRIETIALTDGVLRSGKGLAIRGKEISSKIIRERDLEALRFSIENRFSYIGASHVRSPEDLRIIRKTIYSMGGKQKILAKIENSSAVKNIESIAEEADGVVIARGDLGMNLGLEEIPSIQRRILNICHEMGKPCIVATQILESMMNSPVPTRAEIGDLYSVVSQGVDGVMLTGETAVGLYPVEAVKWAKKVIERAEKDPEITYGGPESRRASADAGRKSRLSYGIYRLSESIQASIAVIDRDPRDVALISINKPRQKIYFVTDNLDTYRQSHLLWGVEPIYLKDLSETSSIIQHLKEKILREGSEALSYSKMLLINNTLNKKSIEIIDL